MSTSVDRVQMTPLEQINAACERIEKARAAANGEFMEIAFNEITRLTAVIRELSEALEFYSDFATGKNNQPIFEDEQSSRAKIFERYQQYSIGDLGLKAHEALAKAAEELSK